MTHEEAEKEFLRLHKFVKNRRAKDPWHLAVYEREHALVAYCLCANCQNDDPGPWEMPPVPEGVEP